MASFTRWILRHRRLVALCWLIVALISLASAGSASNALSKQFALPGMESYEADQAILHTYGNGGSASPIVPVVTLPAGVTVDSPGVRVQLARAFAAMQAALPGARLVSYAGTGDRVFVSRDGRTTFGLIYAYTAPGATSPSALPALQRVVAGLTVDGARFRLTGLGLLQDMSAAGTGPSVLTETLLGAAGALIVLVLVFGSFLALVPLLMALVAIPTTFLLIWG